MRIERISDSIIKVTISKNDLRERNIDLASLNYNSPAAQEFFWELMEQAEIQLGFNLSDSQLIIEPLPDCGNGFIINITKIDEDEGFESIQKYIKSRLKKSELRVKKKSRICSAFLIYSFESIDDVYGLANRLEGKYNGESTLYRCKQTYYLSLTRSGLSPANLKMMELLLNEYGTKITNVSFYEGYLNEYGEKVIENNALEILKQYM